MGECGDGTKSGHRKKDGLRSVGLGSGFWGGGNYFFQNIKNIMLYIFLRKNKYKKT